MCKVFLGAIWITVSITIIGWAINLIINSYNWVAIMLFCLAFIMLLVTLVCYLRSPGKDKLKEITKKKWRYIVIALLFLIIGFFLGRYPAPSPALPPMDAFHDPNLQVAIINEVGKPTRDISISDLENIKELTADNMGITDLSGLQYCTGLRKLSLNNNQITDISPLSSLPDLVELHLWHNQIINTSPLASLTELTYLDIAENQIIDVSPLSSLTHLDDLSLWGNKIKYISSLASLTSLDRLILNDNDINDILPLVNNMNNNGLGSGDMVNLTDNPLNSDSIDKYIPQLQDNDIVVIY